MAWGKNMWPNSSYIQNHRQANAGSVSEEALAALMRLRVRFLQAHHMIFPRHTAICYEKKEKNEALGLSL